MSPKIMPNIQGNNNDKFRDVWINNKIRVITIKVRYNS